MKRRMNFVAGFLSIAMIASTTIPMQAKEVSNEKEEVVYINTDASGNVRDVNVVNIFEKGGNILDYGTYQKVTLLSGNTPINQKDDAITFKADHKKTYYQGTLDNVDTPWNLSIRYELDGKEYSAKDIAGKSGKLKIRFIIEKNEECKNSFYESYALQASFKLNSERCKNIEAKDATIANESDNKQITYTILPGKGIDTSIMADVTDFEMDAVSINGIKLNLNIDINDKELMEKVSTLCAATKTLNEGSQNLTSNSNALMDGGLRLSTGLSSMYQGSTSLDTGIRTLQNGITYMQSALETLNKKSVYLIDGSSKMKHALETIQTNLHAISVNSEQLLEVKDASKSIKQGIGSINDGANTLQQSIGYTQYKNTMVQNNVNIDELVSGNTQAIMDLSAQIKTLQQTLASIEQIEGNENQVAQLQGQITSLQTVVKLLQGNNASIKGTQGYLNNVSKGMSSLRDNINKLNTSYEQFDTGIDTMLTTLNKAFINIGMLSSGIDELVKEYSTLDGGIHDYVDCIAQIVVGYQQIVEGSSSLSSGSNTVLIGNSELKKGADSLYDGIVAYGNGMTLLSNGTNELYTQTSTMQGNIQSQIDDILSSLKIDQETVSFVSEKNNVNAVQFVIKTDAIEKQKEGVYTAENKKTLTMWEKFLQLFGL